MRSSSFCTPVGPTTVFLLPCRSCIRLGGRRRLHRNSYASRELPLARARFSRTNSCWGGRGEGRGGGRSSENGAPYCRTSDREWFSGGIRQSELPVRRGARGERETETRNGTIKNSNITRRRNITLSGQIAERVSRTRGLKKDKISPPMTRITKNIE